METQGAHFQTVIFIAVCPKYRKGPVGVLYVYLLNMVALPWRGLWTGHLEPGPIPLGSVTPRLTATPSFVSLICLSCRWGWV